MDIGVLLHMYMNIKKEKKEGTAGLSGWRQRNRYAEWRRIFFVRALLLM